ncbi:MAG TPA: hypothetical protein VIJ53_12100, partial [Acidobacteriaceae bacterium]
MGCSGQVLGDGSPDRNDENNELVYFDPFPGDCYVCFKSSASLFASAKRIVLFLICFIGIPCGSPAQTNQSSWANLGKLTTGEKIEIVEMTSKKHLGTFIDVS